MKENKELNLMLVLQCEDKKETVWAKSFHYSKVNQVFGSSLYIFTNSERVFNLFSWKVIDCHIDSKNEVIHELNDAKLETMQNEDADKNAKDTLAKWFNEATEPFYQEKFEKEMLNREVSK